MFKTFISSRTFLITCFVAYIAVFSAVFAKTDLSKTSQVTLGNDQQDFIFTGHCPNGDAYRIHAYQMDVDGLTLAFYDFDGPAGKGSVKTNAAPKKMVVRVCHELADIANGSKFD
mgnify:CR=1 FL=1|jgi:hypothetical protein